MPFPVLKDFDHKAADAFGAKRTPEVFLLDAGRVIRYHGRIDDQYGIGYQRAEPTRHDLKGALDELLAGKPVTTATTEVSGCVIGRARRTEEKVTYAQQVSRIVQQRCQECHQPDLASNRCTNCHLFHPNKSRRSHLLLYLDEPAPAADTPEAGA